MSRNHTVTLADWATDKRNDLLGALITDLADGLVTEGYRAARLENTVADLRRTHQAAAYDGDLVVDHKEDERWQYYQEAENELATVCDLIDQMQKALANAQRYLDDANSVA